MEQTGIRQQPRATSEVQPGFDERLQVLIGQIRQIESTLAGEGNIQEKKAALDQWLTECDSFADDREAAWVTNITRSRYPGDLEDYYFGALRVYLMLQRQIDRASRSPVDV